MAAANISLAPRLGLQLGLKLLPGDLLLLPLYLSGALDLLLPSAAQSLTPLPCPHLGRQAVSHLCYHPLNLLDLIPPAGNTHPPGLEHPTQGLALQQLRGKGSLQAPLFPLRLRNSLLT